LTKNDKWKKSEMLFILGGKKSQLEETSGNKEVSAWE
jgi:hypothetical protein